MCEQLRPGVMPAGQRPLTLCACLPAPVARKGVKREGTQERSGCVWTPSAPLLYLGLPAVCRAPASPALWAALSATCCLRVSRCSDFCSPSWHRLVRSSLYTGPSCPGCVRTPAPWLTASRAGSLDTSGGGGKSQQLRWPDSSAVCNVKSALPGTCTSFRHPPWLAGPWS